MYLLRESATIKLTSIPSSKPSPVRERGKLLVLLNGNFVQTAGSDQTPPLLERTGRRAASLHPLVNERNTSSRSRPRLTSGTISCRLQSAISSQNWSLSSYLCGQQGLVCSAQSLHATHLQYSEEYSATHNRRGSLACPTYTPCHALLERCNVYVDWPCKQRTGGTGGERVPHQV